MKRSKIYLVLLLLPLMVACFSDETTDAINPLSTIVVESGIESVYNIGKNDQIVIEPVISQKNKEKPLRYTWEVNLENKDSAATFTFVGQSLGKYNCRFIVENEDGKTFVPFTINVNSPYEEGITVLSKDANGKSMLSFMQKPYGNEKGEFYNYDCFAVNNPDYDFAAGAVDLVQCRDFSGNGSWVIIACQGGGEDNDPPTIYYLNEKTFEVENFVSVQEYEDFKPVKMGLQPTVYKQTSYPILCENGKVYDFSIGEADVVEARKLQSTYAQSCVLTNSATGYEILLYDKANKGLSLIYNGYGPYYCSKKKYHLILGDENFKKYNYYSGCDLVAMTNIRMTKEDYAKSGNRSRILVITSYQAGLFATSEVLYADFWGYDGTETEDEKKYPVDIQNTHDGDWDSERCPLTPETPCIANMTYHTLFFADGNKVRVWDYEDAKSSDLEGLLNAGVFCEVGSADAIVTGFEMSDDLKKTYVAFYEPKKEGLNGSVWVFDTDSKDGKPLEKYDNISYQPVKMIYKKK